MGRQGVIRSANPAACALCARDALVGVSLLDLLPEPYGPLAMALAAFAEDHSPPPPSMEVSLTRPGEEPAPIELRMRVAGAPGARPPAPRRGGAPPR